MLFSFWVLFFTILLAIALAIILCGDELFLIILCTLLLLTIFLLLTLLHMKDPRQVLVVSRLSNPLPKMPLTRVLFFSSFNTFEMMARLQILPPLAEANAISADSLMALFFSRRVMFLDEKSPTWKPISSFLRKPLLKEFEACMVANGKEIGPKQLEKRRD